MYVSTSGLGQTINLSTWTWEDYALVGLGGVALFYLLDMGKTKATRALRRRRSKGSSGGGLGFELPLMLLILGGGAAYLYYYNSILPTGATS
jgi:hypothetical protein